MKKTIKQGQIVFDKNNKEIGMVYSVNAVNINVRTWTGYDSDYIYIRLEDQDQYEYKDSIWTWNETVPLDLYQNTFQQKLINYYVNGFNKVKKVRGETLFNNAGIAV